MPQSQPKSRFIAACLLLALFAVGCHSKQTWWDPFELAYRPPDYPIETPAERIDKMRLLAKRAPNLSQNERERIALDLQKQIQQESDPLVRMEILKTLGFLPTDTSRVVLTAGLSDPDEDVRITCAEAWARRGGDDAVDTLSRIITTDSNIDVRIAAARALGEMKEVKAIPTLGLALVENDPALQYRAMLSIQQISGKDFRNDVRAAQQYVQTGNFERPEESLVQRIVPFY